MDSSL